MHCCVRPVLLELDVLSRHSMSNTPCVSLLWLNDVEAQCCGSMMWRHSSIFNTSCCSPLAHAPPQIILIHQHCTVNWELSQWHSKLQRWAPSAINPKISDRKGPWSMTLVACPTQLICISDIYLLTLSLHGHFISCLKGWLSKDQ